MNTPAKLVANRLNALHSTGPKSIEGKALVARNSTKHGLFSKVPVVAGESAEGWNEHVKAVVVALRPVGALEVNLAEAAALLLWRLQRLGRFEAAVVGAAVEDAGLPPVGTQPALLGPIDRCAATAEQDLMWLRTEHRAARENLTIFAEAADIVRRLSDLGSAVVQGERADVILGWASSLTYDRPIRVYDPVVPSAPEFLSSLGLPPGRARDMIWTEGLLHRAIVYHAAALGQPIVNFKREVEDALDDRAAAFAREVGRVGGQITALQRRQETHRGRAAEAALLPAPEVLDRLMRYERHMHTTLSSTLRELERLRALRHLDEAECHANSDLWLIDKGNDRG